MPHLKKRAYAKIVQVYKNGLNAMSDSRHLLLVSYKMAYNAEIDLTSGRGVYALFCVCVSFL